MVEEQQKVNLKNMSFVSSNSWYGSFSRYYNGESRKNLLEMLNATIAQTIQAINDYSNTEFCTLIVTHLAISKKGILNLKKTYENDPNILSQLETLLENISIQLDKNIHLVNDEPTLANLKHDSEHKTVDIAEPLGVQGQELSKSLPLLSTLQVSEPVLIGKGEVNAFPYAEKKKFPFVKKTQRTTLTDSLDKPELHKSQE